MNKRISQKKLNGQIILKQNELMSKLATINDDKKLQLDQLGFPEVREESDALLSLISKSKDIVTCQNIQTKQNAGKIEQFKKIQQTMKKHKEGTFLTGLGLATEPQRNTPSAQESIETDPDAMLRDLTINNNKNDLEELRKLIRETSCNLEGCSRKLNKNKRSIMHMADRYSNEVPFSTLNVLNNYKEFESGRLQEQEYCSRY